MNTLELKGSSFTLSVLKLNQSQLTLIEQELEKKIAQAPQFFANAPLIVDLENTPDFSDFENLSALLKEHQLFLVGLINCNEQQKLSAAQAGIPLMRKGVMQNNSAPQAEPQPVKEPQRLQSRVIKQTVRSGQQIYASGSDLIIMGSVSNGAEVAADGNVHVYGTLRGRAIAGAQGDTQAQIFCQNLQAELVSIGGHYCLSDSLERQLWQQPCSLKLENNKIITDKL